MAKTYKVWIAVEECDEKNDRFEECGFPDPVGEFKTLREADSLVTDVLKQFNPAELGHSDHYIKGDPEIALAPDEEAWPPGMNKYTMLLTRAASESFQFDVFAEDKDHAEEQAYELVGRYGENVSDWEINDGNFHDVDSFEIIDVAYGPAQPTPADL